MSYGTVQAEKVTTESGYSLGAGNATSFKNRIINGGMTIAQRGTSGTSGGSTYVCDRFLCYAAGGTGAYTATQSSDAPAGFTNSLLATVTTAGTQGESGFLQYIEGYNFADCQWGTSSAKSVTISFWVKSSLTGTFAYILRTTGGSYSYVTSYTINAANTWEYKSITIPGNTASTPNTTNSYALISEFSLGGTGNATSTQNTWLSSNFYNLTGATNVLGTLGATFAVTGVQLEMGTVATSFDFRSFGIELALCQRYFCKTYQLATVPGTATDTNAVTFPLQGTCSYARSIWSFPVNMRTTPTFVSYNTNNGASGQVSGDASNYTNATLSIGEGRVTNGVSSQTIGVDVYLKWHGTASAEF